MEQDIRHDEQQKVVQLYHQRAPLKCTLVLSTGLGKSKIAIDILKEEDPVAIIILVNSTILRDYNWKAEFEKFDAMDLFSRTQLVTYQAAYKWKASEVDLTDTFVIADEVDFAGDTDELAKFFYQYPYNKTLGLTGFITDGKKEWFKTYLPVLTELTAADAQDQGILNNLHFVFVKYDLSDNPSDVVIEYKRAGQTKSFTRSENNAYDYQNKQVQSVLIKMSELRKELLSGDIDIQDFMRENNSLEYKMKMASMKRGDLLLNSKSSQRMTRKLLKYLLGTQPDSKIIIFSKRTLQSQAICGDDNMYNGLIPKKRANQNFLDFKNGLLRYLGVCDKVNRGVNIDELNIAILETFYGSDTQATQRFGRMMRLKPDEMATIYVLLPYYMREERQRKNEDDESFKKRAKFTVQETQQVKWATNMLRSTTIKSYAVWDYRIVKENKTNDQR